MNTSVLPLFGGLLGHGRGTFFSPLHFGQTFVIHMGLMPVPLHVGQVRQYAAVFVA
jgi:hypothetical protein